MQDNAIQGVSTTPQQFKVTHVQNLTPKEGEPAKDFVILKKVGGAEVDNGDEMGATVQGDRETYHYYPVTGSHKLQEGKVVTLNPSLWAIGIKDYIPTSGENEGKTLKIKVLKYRKA